MFESSSQRGLENVYIYVSLISRYYPDVYNISGTFDSFKKYGDFFSYDKSPRAQIFHRDHVNVHDVQSMINIMR